MKKTTVLVSVPNEGVIQESVSEVVEKLVRDGRYKVEVIRPKDRPYESNLCKIVKRFRAEGHDFWLNIDHDNPPLRNPLDLVLYDRDIVGFPTPVWAWAKADQERDYPIYWNAYDYLSDQDTYVEHSPKKGLQRVNAVGSGCFMVARRVFQDQRMQTSPFQRLWNKDGTMRRSADLEFCRRSESCGFKVYAHFDYPCDHIKTLSLTEIRQAFQKFYSHQNQEEMAV